MVYAFLVLSVSATDQGEILYSEVFSEQALVDQQAGDIAEDSSDHDRPPISIPRPSSRRQRKYALQTIANRVAVEYSFNYSISGKSGRDETERLRVDGILPEFTCGTFGLLSPRVEPFFARQKHVVWCGALGNCCAVLVLESEENRSLGESTLEAIFRSIQEYVRVLNNPREVQLKPDYVMVILRHLLPGGCMTFANSRVVRRIEKKLEKSMNVLMNS